MSHRFTRRSCLKTAASAATLTILPAGLAHAYAANEKVKIGVVGAGIGAHIPYADRSDTFWNVWKLRVIRLLRGFR